MNCCEVDTSDAYAFTEVQISELRFHLDVVRATLLDEDGERVFREMPRTLSAVNLDWWP